MLNSLAAPRALLFQTGADRIKLASRTELFVFVGDEIGAKFAPSGIDALDL